MTQGKSKEKLDTSFTDGKPQVATERECKAPWNGARDGSNFRCRLCGHKFIVGDTWRWVFANFADSPSRYGNFLTCETCDGSDVLARAARQEEEVRTRFWWLGEVMKTCRYCGVTYG